MCESLPPQDLERMRSWQDEKDAKKQERLLKKTGSSGSPPASSSVAGGSHPSTHGTTNSIQIPHQIENVTDISSGPLQAQQHRRQSQPFPREPDSSKKRRLDFGGNAGGAHDMTTMFGQHTSLIDDDDQVSHQALLEGALRRMAPLRSPITCHVLDSMSGKPAPGMRVQLDRFVGNAFTFYAQGMTDNDGRCGTLLPPSPTIDPGVYKMTFYTKEYFGTRNISSFYPFVEIAFEIKVADEHYHVPLLLSPYAYSTYRGS
ncbi:hypothetical protein OIV83_001724 [Microbotryomycetes sp. JL201]|nr:hypothetical protein OIV83_001724 [Microbotryomycetes sp. JL201]